MGASIGNIPFHISEILFVAFTGADYNRCLWIYKKTRFCYCFGKGWVLLAGSGGGVGGWCKVLNVCIKGGIPNWNIWLSLLSLLLLIYSWLFLLNCYWIFVINIIIVIISISSFLMFFTFILFLATLLYIFVQLK